MIKIRKFVNFGSREFITLSLKYEERVLRILTNIYNGALWETANSYNSVRNISFSCLLVYEINDFFNTGLIFTPEVFIQYKNYEGGGWWGRGLWILKYIPEVLRWYYSLLLTFNIFLHKRYVIIHTKSIPLEFLVQIKHYEKEESAFDL